MTLKHHKCHNLTAADVLRHGGDDLLRVDVGHRLGEQRRPERLDVRDVRRLEDRLQQTDGMTCVFIMTSKSRTNGDLVGGDVDLVVEQYQRRVHARLLLAR